MSAPQNRQSRRAAQVAQAREYELAVRRQTVAQATAQLRGRVH